MRMISTLVATLFATPLPAHELDELTISRFARIGNGPYLEIILDQTVKGNNIACAVYSEGNVVATDTRITDNLATKVLIRYEGAVDSARCVYNN